MPVYEYKGVTSQGKKVSGVQDGEGLKTVRAKLKKDGKIFHLWHCVENAGAYCIIRESGIPQALRFISLHDAPYLKQL